MATARANSDAIQYREVENCADYRSFVFPLNKAMTAAAHSVVCARLSELGTADKERLGVTYVRGAWGFLVLPPKGFPELRVSFYKETDTAVEQTILDAISKALQMMSTNEA